jgi:hypothetical protein
MRYDELIKTIQIRDILVTSLNFERQLPLDSQFPQGSKYNVESKMSIKQSGESLIGRMHFQLTALSDEGASIFTMKGTILAKYQLPGGAILGRTLLKKFADNNVKVNVWPYLRALVFQHTGGAGLPSLTLNVLRRV